jgi:hypothetical protein
MKIRDHFVILGIDGMITLKWILETGCEDMDWNHLPQGRYLWQALVNMEMNLWVAQKADVFD